jgi:hypothetical protein
MASQLDHSATLRIGATISSSFRTAVGGVSGATRRLQSNIAGLRETQRGLVGSLHEAEGAARQLGASGSAAVASLASKHRALESELRAVTAELARAERAAVRLGGKAADEVARLRRESDRLEREERQVAEQLRNARREAERLGVEGSADVARLRAEHERLGSVLDREQRKLARVKALAELDVGSRVRGSLRGLSDNLASLTSTALRGATVIGGVGAAAVGWFTKSSLDATAGIERMETALETLEGSQPAARRSMDWIVEFADRTPFNLEQVGEAFTRLRAFGIDPTDGTLRTLGDTAASMGKDVMQAVEAMADAVTGETERLKEFGIRSATEGKRLTFFYKNKLGEDVQKTVDKTSQTAIRTMLAAIWNEKYAGSMEKASRTWSGLMSTLESKWTLFQVRVMRTGVIDALKSQLVGLLDNINIWAEDGTLDRWANEIGAAYRTAFKSIGEGFAWVRTNWPEIKKTMGELWNVAKKAAPVLLELGRTLLSIGKWAVQAAGGPKNLAIGLAALGGLKVLAPLGGLLRVGFDISKWLFTSTGLSTRFAGALGGLGTRLVGLGPQLAGLGAQLGPAGMWAVGIAGAAAFGYAAGRVLDNLIGKALDLRGGLLSVEAGLRAGESDTFNRWAENVGDFLGWDTLAEAARGNRRRNEALSTPSVTKAGAQPRGRRGALNGASVGNPGPQPLGLGGALSGASVGPTPVTLGWDPVADAAREAQKRTDLERSVRTAAERGAKSTVQDNRVFHIRVDAAKANADEVAEKVSERLKRDMRREALASHG